MYTTCNLEQRLYVEHHGTHVSCLGFDNAFEQTTDIATELARPDLMPRAEHVGVLNGWNEWQKAIRAAAESNRKLTCGLTRQLIGLEGKRVEVVDNHGAKRRFKVGKSTGFIPCHLELYNSRSSGGCAVTGAPFQSVREV